MESTITVEGPATELRQLEQDLVLGNSQIRVEWAPAPHLSLMDDDNLGMSPWTYFVVVFAAHLSVEATVEMVKLIHEKAARYARLRIKGDSDDSDGPDET